MKRLGPRYDIGNHYTSEPGDLNSSAGQAKHQCTTEFLRNRQHANKGAKKGSKNQNKSKSKSNSDKKNKSATNNENNSEIIGYERYVERLEILFSEWEQYGHNLFDQQTESILRFAREIHDEIVLGSMAKAESMVKYLETTSIGHEVKDLELIEKVSRAVDYIDKTVEESRLSVAIQKALASACNGLLTFDELPGPWQENPYIKKGYRFSSNWWECLKSIFNWHNETANIWTHLLAAIMFVGLGLFHLPSTTSWQNGTWIDRIPMILFIIAALKCLLCSVTWHSFSSISHLGTKQCMACVDYTGITVCICASILTTEYSVLNCHPFAQAFYMTITFVCGIFGIVLNWHPMFDSTGARPLRALFFSCFAVFGGICGVHACFYRGAAETLAYYYPILKSIACYAVGVLFYATLFPERYIKGLFDYCGMSHNIWHAFVVAGIYYHYKAMIEIFDTAVNEVCAL